MNECIYMDGCAIKETKCLRSKESTKRDKNNKQEGSEDSIT